MEREESGGALRTVRQPACMHGSFVCACELASTHTHTHTHTYRKERYQDTDKEKGIDTQMNTVPRNRQAYCASSACCIRTWWLCISACLCVSASEGMHC